MTDERLQQIEQRAKRKGALAVTAQEDVPWLIAQLRDARAENEVLRTTLSDSLTAEAVQAICDGLRAELAAERAKVQRIERRLASWADFLHSEWELMTTPQRNAWINAEAELRAALTGKESE